MSLGPGPRRREQRWERQDGRKRTASMMWDEIYGFLLLLVTGATLVVTSALLVVTKS